MEINISKQNSRELSSFLKINILFGGAFNQIGWLIFGFALIFFWAFALNADLNFIWFAAVEKGQTRGVITESISTNAAENHSYIYANHYTFRAQGNSYKGVSYDTGGSKEKGEPVSVEYSTDNPEMSRIVGMRMATFPAWTILVVIFPLGGIALLTVGIRKSLKSIELLQMGKLGYGILKDKTDTGGKVNNKPVYKYTFEFIAEDGKSYTVSESTHLEKILEDDEKESLLYNPFNPSYAVIVDSLPASVKIDEMDRIQITKPLRWVILILPVFTVLTHGLYALSLVMK